MPAAPRGPILTWMLFSFTLAALWNLLGGSVDLQKAACAHDQKIAFLVIVAGLTELVCVLGLVFWKRWAAVGMFSANLLLVLVVRHEGGVITIRAVVSLALLFFGVASRWRHFE